MPSVHSANSTILYLPAFKKLVVDAKVELVMGAYNRTLDEPCCASQLLLVDILRGEWDFQGHVVSDCGALSDFHNNHKITADAAESSALALKKAAIWAVTRFSMRSPRPSSVV